MSKVVTYKDNTSGSGNRETITTKYVYDGAGNRVKAKVELNGSVASNTTYVVDGESSYNDIIMAKDSVSGKTSIFTFSDKVISVETSGNISYYRTDEKNSVTDILDTTGKVKATIKYDEYGVIANPEVVSTGGNIFAYTGHVYEESTGMYYAKARYYDAGTGRFVSEDSYKGNQNESQSLNVYTYCTNSPITYYDLSGYILQRPIFSDGGKRKGKLVTVEQLINFGWIEPNQKLADEINEALNMFGINKGKYAKEQIILFMATTGHEAGMGGYDYIQRGASSMYRGAGALQLTTEYNYKMFDEYLIDNKKGYNGEIMKSDTPYKVVAEKYAWMSAAWYWTELKPVKSKLDSYMDSGYKLYDSFIVITAFIQGFRGSNEDYKKIAAGKYKKIDYSSAKDGYYKGKKTYKVVNIKVINGGIVVSSNNWNDRKDKFDDAYDAFGGH